MTNLDLKNILFKISYFGKIYVFWKICYLLWKKFMLGRWGFHSTNNSPQ